nr:immunoglobulin light chain junction region [Macaca mulatta]
CVQGLEFPMYSF